MSDLFGEPFQLDEAGDHLEASKAAFELAIDELVEADFDPMVEAGAPIGSFLFALSNAVRGGDRRRAEIIYGVSAALIQHVLDGNDEPAVEGLCHEWLGDGLTMLESPEALEQYVTALEYYKTANKQAVDTWHLELGYDISEPAYRRFIKFSQLDVNIDRLNTTDFERLTEAKIEFVFALLERQYF